MCFPVNHRLAAGKGSLDLTAGSKHDYVVKFKPNRNRDWWAGEKGWSYFSGYDKKSGWIYFKIDKVRKAQPLVFTRHIPTSGSSSCSKLGNRFDGVDQRLNKIEDMLEQVLSGQQRRNGMSRQIPMMGRDGRGRPPAWILDRDKRLAFMGARIGLGGQGQQQELHHHGEEEPELHGEA